MSLNFYKLSSDEIGDWKERMGKGYELGAVSIVDVLEYLEADEEAFMVAVKFKAQKNLGEINRHFYNWIR